MKSVFRIMAIILVLATATVGVLFATGCDYDNPSFKPPVAPVEPGKPTPTPDPDPEPAPTPDPEPTAAQIIKSIYEATVPNFTASVTVTERDGKDSSEKKIAVVYDKKEGGSFTDGEDEFICADGLVFERVGEIKIKDDDGERTVPTYSAKRGTLEKLSRILEKAGEISVSLAEKLKDSISVDATDKEIMISCKLSYAKTLGKLFDVVKRNTDKPVARFVSDAIEEFGGERITDEEAALLLVGIGDMTLEKVVEERGELFKFELFAAYGALKAALGGIVELPAFDDFIATYGQITVKALLGAESADELFKTASELELSEVLKKFPYMQSTLLSLFSSSAETSFEKADISVGITSDLSHRLSSLRIAGDIEIENFPTFLPSLDESGMREEIIGISRSFEADVVFSKVGESGMKSPEYFAYEGEQTVEVVCGGEYAFHAGELNTFDGDGELVLEVESGTIEDPVHWAEIMKTIHEGTEIDRNAKKIRISDKAYKALVEAKKLGLTRIAVPAYREFVFVLDIR